MSSSETNIQNLQKNIQFAKSIAEKLKNSNDKNEIAEYKKILKTYSSTLTLHTIDETKVVDLQNLTKLEKLIDAKPYFEPKIKNRNTNKLGNVVTPEIQVIQAYQNLLGTSYRKAFHSKTQLEEQVSNDGYEYNKILLQKYNILQK